MNDVQTLALVSVLNQDQERESEQEWQRFRSAIIANNPGEAKKILEALDGVSEEDQFAPELTEEEMEDYERLSHEEIEATIADLRKFGIAVR